jgi:hypothetical protein
MLSSLRYLPSFCGRWEIELYPNWNNIVVCPVSAACVLGATKWSGTAQENLANVTKSFMQIGEPFTMINQAPAGAAGAGDLVTVLQRLTCSDASATEVYMNLTTFQLRFEVFEGLRQMYAEQPLIIPTNILHYSRFSGQPGDNNVGTVFHATLSQCLENCDSIFILVPNNTNQQTCFYQPFLDNVRIALGEFGIHPGQYVNTYDDPRFLAMILDSLNLETSEITAMNDDICSSFVLPKRILSIKGPASVTNPVTPPTWETTWIRGNEVDDSNFFIGISLSQVGFQAGTVSSPNTNIPFIFDATLAQGSLDLVEGTKTRPGEFKLDASIICTFLIDAAIMIQVVPNSDIPIVKLTNKSIV